jgi:nucleoid-associated protein EbfC
VFPGGTPDMSELLQQAQQMQQQLMSAQAELAETEVKGTSGGGLVTATVSGTGELRSLDIKPEAVDPDDIETLSDLIVAAVHDANANAQALQASKLGPMAGMFGGAGGPGGPGGPGALPGGGMPGLPG